MRNRNVAVLLVAGMACGSAAMAGPLAASHVATDATWVVHLDMEGFLASSLGQQPAIQDLMRQLHAEFNAADQNLGIDPARDIRDITISGINEDDHNALVVVNATAALDAPLARLGELVDGYRAISEGTSTIHTWTDGDETIYAFVQQGADAAQRTAVFSQNLESLRAGMLRIGQGAAATMPEALRDDGPAAGAFVHFRGADFANALGEDAAAMLRSAESMTFNAGDLGGRFFARVTLTTADADQAVTIQQAVQGMYAMARLAMTTEADAAGASIIKLMNGFSTTVDGSRVTLGFEQDSAEVGRLLGELVVEGGIEANLERLAIDGRIDVEADVKSGEKQVEPD